MLCRNPLVQGSVAFKCGQCLPCRINRQRVWQHRIMLEATQWKENAFVTLTYSDEWLPFVDAEKTKATLVPEHLQKWLKRMRKVLSPAKIRFFGVGEYGQMGKRRDVWHPHYHVAVFGLASCVYGDSRFGPRLHCNCVNCSVVKFTWRFGTSHLGHVEPKSAQYLAGYTLKNMRRFDNVQLQGRYPEFARMSLRPGIGAGAADQVRESYERYALVEDVGVQASLAHGKKVYPLGTYLRNRIAVSLGVEDVQKERNLEEASEALRPLREIAAALSDAEVYRGTFNKEIFRRLIVEQGTEKVRQMEARQKLFGQRKK